MNNDDSKIWTFKINDQTYAFESPPQVGMRFKLEIVEYEVIDVIKGEYLDGSRYCDLKVKPLFTPLQQAILDLVKSTGIKSVRFKEHAIELEPSRGFK